MPFSEGCLAGIRILDLSRVLAGPWATQVFGDLGANVIKVEEKLKGDETRQWGPPYFEDQSAYFLSTNRNKRSIAVDFNDPVDLKNLKALIKDADIIVENFKKGSLKKWQLDYLAVERLNKKIIYCTISGFASEGPYAELPGYDALIQAASGLMSVTGADADSPTKVGVAISDLLTGMYASTGILAALYAREKSGHGQHIEVPLFETQVQCLANVAMNFLVSKEVPTPLANSHPSIVPYRSYQTSDKPLMLAIGNDRQFARLSECLAVSWHQQPEYSTNPQRVKNRTTLDREISQLIVGHNREYWLQRFSGKGFPFGPVNGLDDVASDEHVKATGLFSTMNDEKTPLVKNPLRFSKNKIKKYSPPPKAAKMSTVSW